MKLNPYPKYKDSGVEWIGKIPDNWKIFKLKHVVNEFISGGTPKSDNAKFWADDNEGIPWIAISDMTNQDFIYNTQKKITFDGLADKKLRILPKMTIIYSIFASLGKVSILKINGTTNQAILGFLLNDNIDLFYLKYYLIFLEDPILSLSNSNTQNNLNSSIVKNIELVLPNNISKQEQIANFLDKKTSTIDKAIEKNKKLIELLEEKRTSLINHVITKGLDPNAKMKDSGVEWIGEIPGDWQCKKIKEVAEVKISNVDKKSKENEPNVFLCNYIDVYNNEFIDNQINFMKSTASFDQIKKLSLIEGDVIITKDSESPDDIAIPSLVNGKLINVVCGYHLALLRPNKNSIHSYFLLKLLESKKINDQFFIATNGVTRFGISTYPIKNSHVIIPSLSEQKKISNYLKKNIVKINKLTNDITNQNFLLEEYKKSIIYHVITGKVDVRGVE